MLGLQLFEAEEQLARGAPDKAVVTASRAVKDRPDSLTARALLDRARRELLRGRRREKLEQRLREAKDLFEAARFDSAERIVTSALKLLPTHPVALELFGKMRQRRLQADSAEALAERELDRLARGQARQALEAARSALAGGWERKAVLAIRRGLRLVPDEPDLQALLEQVLRSQDTLDRERGRRHALLSQIRAGLDLLSHGELSGSLKILRAVLREEPDNARAQAAVQEVRRVWLLRRAVAQAAAEEPPAAAPAPAPRTAVPIRVPAPARAPATGPLRPRTAEAPAPPLPGGEPRRRPNTGPLRTSASEAPSGARAATGRPAEALLPRRRSGPPPLVLAAAGAVIFTVIVLVVAFGRTGRSTPPPRPPATPASQAPAEAPPEEVAEGPLARVEPALRRAISQTLAGYGRALETADEKLLARVRPDMTPAQRTQVLTPFVGALNAATDLRVIDVVARGDEVVAQVLRTDVIVLEGGRGGSGPPVEENLVFQRRDGAWALR